MMAVSHPPAREGTL